MTKSLSQAIADNRAKRDTPWGRADHVTSLGEDGIVSVSTPSHGGIYVPDDLLSSIPAKYRKWAKKWSGSENWYEEDCCWMAVAMAFPHLFPNIEDVTKFKTMVEEYSSMVK